MADLAEAEKVSLERKCLPVLISNFFFEEFSAAGAPISLGHAVLCSAMLR